MVALWRAVSRTARWAAGSFVFCRADAFRASGASRPTCRRGRGRLEPRASSAGASARGLGFVILAGEPHVSSGRKFYLYRPAEFLAMMWKIALSPRRGIRDNSVNAIFYDGRR